MLETKRLILKPTNNRVDLDHVLALWADPEVMRYTASGVQTEEQVKEWILYAEAYFEKYGLGFFSVFEKETNEFVGQAGLVHLGHLGHLGFDDKQSEIELVYRLHTQFWSKGYATELAKMLIQWGFEKQGLSKIIAIFNPKNESSRRVMEKAGMSYYGMIPFKGHFLPCYEVVNHQIDWAELKMLPASLEVDYPIIQNMAAYYAYDLSEYMRWSQEKDGTSNIGMDYISYWKEPNTYPFIIKYKDELAGFVIVDTQVCNLANNFNIAQFFILRRFKGMGFGRHIAFQCFDSFQGKWEVFVMPGNEAAYRFWRKIITEYTDSQFTECTKTVNKFNRNIFEFESSNSSAIGQ